MKRQFAKEMLAASLSVCLLTGCSITINPTADSNQSPSSSVVESKPPVTSSSITTASTEAPTKAPTDTSSKAQASATPAPEPISNNSGNSFSSNNVSNDKEYSNLSFLTDDQQHLYNTAYGIGPGLYGMADNLMHLWGYKSVSDLDENYVLYDADYDAFSAQIHMIFTDDCLRNTDYAIKFINYNGKLAVYDFLSNDMVEGTTAQVNEAFPNTFRLVSSTDNKVEFMLISHYDRNGWNNIDDPMDVYTIEYPIRMIHTDDGWRIDEFHTTHFG